MIPGSGLTLSQITAITYAHSCEHVDATWLLYVLHAAVAALCGSASPPPSGHAAAAAVVCVGAGLAFAFLFGTITDSRV